MDNKPNIDQNSCSICGKTFQMKSNLNKHMQIVHEKLRPFPCGVCGKMFPTAQAFKIHNDHTLILFFGHVRECSHFCNLTTY